MVRFWGSLLFIVSYVVQVNAQQDFLETRLPVNATALASNAATAAFAQDQTIFLMDVETMELQDYITLDLDSNTTISSLEYTYADQALLVHTKSERHKIHDEFPQDSIYAVSLQQRKVINTFPGNKFVELSFESGTGVEAYNLVEEWRDQEGGVHYNPFPGEIMTYPSNTRVPAPDVVRQLAISPDSHYAAIVYYKNLTEDYVARNCLEIRTLPELQVVDTIEFMGRAKSIRFSDCSRYLLLNTDNDPFDFKENRSDSLTIFSIDPLTKVDKIPSDIVFPRIVANNKIWHLSEGQIYQSDFNTQKKIQNIWSKLTPFFFINGFHVLNDDELLIYGENSSLFGGKKSGLYKLSLSNLAVYSNIPAVATIDTIFDPAKAILQNNDISALEDQSEIAPESLSAANGLLVVSSGGHLQLISVLEKRKLYDLYFQDEVKAFINPQGTHLIIFETLVHKRYDNFIVKKLDITTGVMTSKAFTDNPYGFVNPTSGDFFAFYLDDDHWLISDGSAKLWKINMTDLTFVEIYDSSNRDYDFTTVSSLARLPNSSIFIAKTEASNGFKDSKPNDVFVYDHTSGSIRVLDKLRNVENIHPLSPYEFIFSKRGKEFIYNLKTNVFNQLSFPHKSIMTVLSDQDNTYLLVEKNNFDSLFAYRYAYGNKHLSEAFSLPWSRSHFLFKGNIYYNTSGLTHIYSPQFNTTVPWPHTSPTYTSTIDFSVNDNGLIQFYDMMISLTDLEIREENVRYASSSLFHKSDSILVINTHNQFDVKAKPSMSFSIYSLADEVEPVWTSKRLKFKSLFAPDEVIISPNDKFAAVYYSNETSGDLDKFYLIDLSLLKASEVRLSFPIARLSFSKDGQHLLLNESMSLDARLNSNQVRSHIFSIADNKITASWPFYLEEIIDASNYLYRPRVSSSIALGNDGGDKIELKKTFNSRSLLTTSCYLAQQATVVAGDQNGNLFIWDTHNTSPHTTLKLGYAPVAVIQCLNEKLYVLLENAQVVIIDSKTYEVLVNLSIFDNRDKGQKSLVWYTPTGYYKAAKNDIRRFHFVKNLKTLPLSSIDLIMNRPDTIISALGFSSPKLVSAYKAAYYKRLARHNLDPQIQLAFIEQPQIEINNRTSIPAVTDAKSLTLDISLLSPIHTLYIDVNGVPDQTLSNISNQSDLRVQVKLSNGDNQINLVAVSKEGVESDPLVVHIHNSNTNDFDIHFFGVGVSQYSDNRMNLEYADSDVRTLTSFFVREYKDRLKIDTLTNANGTKAQILAWKEKLMRTTVDDIVILSFSGHGLIDESNQFYFGTHNINFLYPREEGLSYQEIQWLLDSIPARRKLLLLDACHSGEIETSSDSTRVVIIDDVQFRGTKRSDISAKQLVINTTFELMKSLFYDLNRGNGAFVIAASAGQEYAFESEEWQNGVFTYSVISAMRELNDNYKRRNKGPARISELQAHVYQNVIKLTDGSQRPIARSENIVWDWTFE